MFFFSISGRSFSNSVINLGIQDQYAEALSQLGFEFEVVAEQVLLTFNFTIFYFIIILFSHEAETVS